MAKRVEKPKDEDWDERPDTVRSCDKEDHFRRSVAHQPNHLKHEAEIQPRNTSLPKTQGQDSSQSS